MQNNITARVTHNYDASIAHVWKAITDNNMIPQWMKGTKADSDWREGSPINWEGEWEGKPFKASGKVLTAQKPHTLKYTHLDSRPEATTHTITIQLQQEGDGTRLELSQDGNDQEGADMGEKIWSSMFFDLETVLKGKPLSKASAVLS